MTSDLRPLTSGALKPGAKPDPYATPAHKSVNVLLIVLTALLIFIVFRTSPLAHRNTRESGDTTNQSHQSPGK